MKRKFQIHFKSEFFRKHECVSSYEIKTRTNSRDYIDVIKIEIYS